MKIVIGIAGKTVCGVIVGGIRPILFCERYSLTLNTNKLIQKLYMMMWLVESLNEDDPNPQKAK